MTVQDIKALAGLDIPQPHGSVITATGQNTAIWVNGDRPNSIGKSLVDPYWLTRGDLPEADLPHDRSYRQQLPIRAKSN
jgi:hypothetical protein